VEILELGSNDAKVELLEVAVVEALVREAHEKVCPYSHATRGNISVDFEVIGS